MAGNTLEKRIVVRSRMADGYELTEAARKQIQHVLTDLFPRAIFSELTDDTVRIDIVVRKGRTTTKNVYNVSFLRADGSLIKNTEYDEDRLGGKVCESYEQTRSGYYGKKDGHDYRILTYVIIQPRGPFASQRRPR